MSDFAHNFPDYAQSSFERLCDLANVTKNRSIQDREGWDYLVEFPRARISGLPHDQQPGNATVRVQVKSKTGGKPAASLKLSNALRFANEPNPCVVLLWWRTPNHSEERIYARHFDEQLIEATLRRAREAQRDGEQSLNRIRLSFSFQMSDDHTSDLVAWLRSIGDTDPRDYGIHKLELTRKLGFGPSSLSGTLSVPYGDVQKLIDAAVGLPTDPADVEIKLDNRRFDIVAPILASKPGIFNLNAIPSPGRLTFQGEDGGEATFAGEVRRFSLPQLPIETVRATFTSPGMSGVIRGAEFNINYNIAGDEAHPLDRLQALARFVVISEKRFSVSLTIEGVDGPLRTSCPPIAMADRFAFVWLDSALASLRACCGPLDNPVLRAADVIAARDELTRFATAGSPSMSSFDLQTSVGVDFPVIGNLVAFRLVRIGSLTFYSIHRRACLDQSSQHHAYHFRFNDPAELEAGVVEMEERAARQTVEHRFKALVTRIGKGALILNGGDYLSVMRGEGPQVEVV